MRLHTFLSVLIVLCLVLGAGVVPASFAEDSFKISSRSEHFFEVLGDVPLMPGLQELPSEAFNFDKPDGRIAQSKADIGALSHDSILSYYGHVLPQFGWQQQETYLYVRNSEQMMFSFEAPNYLKISIAPLLHFEKTGF